VSAVLELALVANARLPSHRAQSLQVIQAAGAFARAGAATTLYFAERQRTPPLPAGVDLFVYYGVPAGPRPALERVACIDWIDRMPRSLQYLPARVQELSFARNAAKALLVAGRGVVLSREVEVARHLLRRGRERVFLELHRVPGGRTRRGWLLEAGRGVLGVVAISGGVRDDLVALGIDPARIAVEHDALEPARFASAPSRALARERLRIPLEAPLAVYTGGLLEWKGVDVLVEAARRLPEIRFLIAGGMEADVARVRELARGSANVRVDGFQPPARVVDYLAAADLAVVPNRSRPAISARYTSPLKVFEAMALGVPLVASDLPSLRELLVPELDAVLVAPDDAAELARGIERLMGDEGLRARIGERLASRSAEHTWDARARRILAWMASRH